MKRICMIVSNSVSNDQRVKREALALHNAGFDVKIIGFLGNHGKKNELWNGIKICRISPINLFKFPKTNGKKTPNKSRTISCHTEASEHKKFFIIFWEKLLLPLEIFRFVVGLFRYAVPIIKECLGFKPHVIHSHDLDVMIYALISSLISKSKLVYDSHEVWIEWKQAYKTPKYMIYFWTILEKIAFKRMSFMVTVSDAMKHYFVKSRRIEPERIIVVRNCPEFEQCQKNKKIWGKFGVPSDQPIVIHQGLIKRDRGIKEILEAAKYVPEVNFVFIGPVACYYKNLFKNTPPNVFWIDFIPYEDLKKLTCNADIGLVMTQPNNISYSVSLSNKIFDYLKVGLPIVASSLRSHRELANETGSVICVNPYEPLEIANAIRELINSPKLMEKMGEKSLLWARQKYNADNEMKKLVDAYEKLI